MRKVTQEIVSLVRYSPDSHSLRTALELCGGLGDLKTGDRVLIKPNLVISGPPTQKPRGIVTSAKLMRELVALLKEHDCGEIAIGEGSIIVKEFGTSTKSAMDWSGMNQIASEFGINTVDFNRGPFKEFKVEGIKIRVASAPLDTDFLIDFPVLKTHTQTKVSLGTKNLKGCLSPGSKRIFHKHSLEELIAFLAHNVKVDMTIIDGLYGLQKGPMGKDIHQMNLVIAGKDLLSVDMVGSAVMGIDPREVNHLHFLAGLQGRTLSISDVDVRGESIASVTKKLIWHYPWVEELFNKYGIRGIRCNDPGNYFCSGCTITAFAGLNRSFREHQGRHFEGVEICLGGEKAHPDSRQVFLVGKCAVTANQDIENAIRIKGCPASAREIHEKLYSHLN
jgi:uncharacterized protein (DUF362 family)